MKIKDDPKEAFLITNGNSVNRTRCFEVFKGKFRSVEIFFQVIWERFATCQKYRLLPHENKILSKSHSMEIQKITLNVLKFLKENSKVLKFFSKSFEGKLKNVMLVL
jgi:hypothetical protein